MWGYKTAIVQQRARRKCDFPGFKLDNILNCSPSCLVIVVHFMSAGNWTFLSLRGGCMAVAALCVPFYALVVVGKLKSMRECFLSISICTSHILGSCLLVSGALRSMCNTILSTLICSSVFFVSSTVAFSPPAAEKSPFRRVPKGTKETES